MAAALVLGFSSCGNDEDPAGGNTGDTKSVLLKVSSGTPYTYADEASQSGLSTAIDVTLGADVYFMNGTAVTDHFPIVADALAAAGDITVTDLKTGYTFPSVSGSANTVYIVVNRPAGVTLPTGGSLSAIEAVALNITSFTVINAVTMKGSGTITTGTPSTATVNVAPVVARFEIAKVEYDATAPSSLSNPVTSYNLEGIFVNNHHKTMGMNFTPIAGQLYSSILATDYTVTNFPAPVGDIFTGKTGVTSYTPSSGAWAYQFFPVDPVNAAADQPMLVIKLSNIVDPATQFTGDQYISVNKFEDAVTPGTYITKFDANHIYKIASIKFSNRNLSVTPGTLLQDVSVTVLVTPWVDKNINPEL